VETEQLYKEDNYIFFQRKLNVRARSINEKNPPCYI